jgi:hypothetical protein
VQQRRTATSLLLLRVFICSFYRRLYRAQPFSYLSLSILCTWTRPASTVITCSYRAAACLLSARQALISLLYMLPKHAAIASPMLVFHRARSPRIKNDAVQSPQQAKAGNGEPVLCIAGGCDCSKHNAASTSGGGIRIGRGPQLDVGNVSKASTINTLMVGVAKVENGEI